MRERAKRIFERVRTRCHSELVSESPANLVGQQDFEHRKTILSAFIERFRMTKTSHSSFAKAIAFTLAETLVVMGIIGVVAALTIPNLNQSTGDREKVAKVKKIYSNLEDAFGRAQAVYGPIEEWFVGIEDDDKEALTTKFAGRIEEFLKVSKKCEYDNPDACFITERADATMSTEVLSYILADGTSLAMGVSSAQMNPNSLGLNRLPAIIAVDIDGDKGANSYGKDTFAFSVYEDLGIVAYGAPNTPNGENLSESCFSDKKTSKLSCTGWVIETGNMDYLKATNGKCPNGTVLSWENTSCK